MSEPSTTRASGSWVDSIVVGLRAATRELAASQEWLSRAGRIKAGAWRATFVLEARAHWKAATRSIGEVESQLGASGSGRAGDGLAPLEQLRANIAAMRAKLAGQDEALGAALAALAGAAQARQILS